LSQPELRGPGRDAGDDTILTDKKVYIKDEMADLTPQQRKAFQVLIKAELDARRK